MSKPRPGDPKTDDEVLRTLDKTNNVNVKNVYTRFSGTYIDEKTLNNLGQEALSKLASCIADNVEHFRIAVSRHKNPNPEWSRQRELYRLCPQLLARVVFEMQERVEQGGGPDITMKKPPMPELPDWFLGRN